MISSFLKINIISLEDLKDQKISIEEIPFFQRTNAILFENLDMDIKDNIIYLIGIPYDGSSSGKSGSKSSPGTVRAYFLNSTYKYKDIYCNTININPLQFYFKNIYDYGDITCFPGESSESVHDRIYKGINNIISINDKKKCIFLGGDHSITYPILKSLNNIYFDISFIKIDAHYDSSGIIENLPINHHNYVDKIREMENVKKIFHLGVREPCLPYFNVQGDFILKPNEIEKYKIINNLKDKDNIYISIDIDVLEPLINPGTSYHIPCGLSLDNLLDLMRIFNKYNVIGIDIVEYNPLLDKDNKSLKNVIDILHESISILRRDV